MNKVETVSISGISFVLDEEAYAILKRYLDDLETYYLQDVNGKEILAGFEERIAELLIEMRGDSQIVSRHMAEIIVATIGHPEIGGEIHTPSRVEAPKERQKLFRDVDHRVFGGVCSGLASLLGIDPVLMRLIWVAVFFTGMYLSWCLIFTGLQTFTACMYLILWICMPAGKATPQITSRHNPVATRTDSRRSSGFWNGAGAVLRIIFGIILIIIGAIGILGCLATVIGTSFFGIGETLKEWVNLILDTDPTVATTISSGWAKLLAGLAVLLPFVGMLYGGLVMAFNLQPPKWHPGLVIASVWLVVVITLSIILIGSIIPNFLII